MPNETQKTCPGRARNLAARPADMNMRDPDGQIPLVQVRQVVKIYQRGREAVQALRGVDLDVALGEFVVILGPSGGGKSTLLHLLGGVDRPPVGL